MADLFLPVFFGGIAVYLLSCPVATWRTWRMQRRGDWLIRLFVFLLALALTLMSQRFTPFTEHVLRAPANLAIWLGYVLALVAGVCALVGAADILRVRVNRRLIVLGSLLPLTILFVILPALALDAPYHSSADNVPPSAINVPPSAIRVIFHLTIYFYLFAMAHQVAVMTQEKMRAEKIVLTRARIGALTGGARLIEIFALTRSIVWLGAFYRAPRAWIDAGHLASEVTLLLGALCIGLAFFPWRRAAPLLWYLEEQSAVADLLCIANELARTTPRLPWSRPTWRDRLRDPRYTLHCVLIEIMDRYALVPPAARPAPPLLQALSALPADTEWVPVMQAIRAARRRCSPHSPRVWQSLIDRAHGCAS